MLPVKYYLLRGNVHNYQLILYLFCFLILLFTIGAGKREPLRSFSEYAVGRRDSSNLTLACFQFILMLGTFSLFGFSHYVATYGTSTILFFLLIPCLYLFFSKRLIPCFSVFNNFLTMGDVMQNYFGKYGRVASAFLGFNFSFFLFGFQSLLLTKFLSSFIPYSPRLIFPFVLAVCGLGVMWRGAISLLNRTLVYATLILAGVPILGNLLFAQSEGYRGLIEAMTTQPFFEGDISSGISLFIILMVFYIDPIVIQCFFMGKNVSQSSLMLRRSSILMIPFFVLIFLLASIGLKSLPLLPTGEIYSSLIYKFTSNHLLPFVVLSFVALIISSADISLHHATLYFTQDVVGIFRKDPSPKTKIWVARGLSLGLPLIFYLISPWAMKFVNLILCFQSMWIPLVLLPFFITVLTSFRCSSSRYQAIIFLTLFTYIFCGLFFPKNGIFYAFLSSCVLSSMVLFINKDLKNALWGVFQPKKKSFPYAIKPPLRRQKKLKSIWKFFYEGSAKRVRQAGAPYVLFGGFLLANYIVPFFHWSETKIALNQDTIIVFRFLSACFGCLLILKNYWPARLKPYLPLFWHFAVLYSLPFLTFIRFLESGMKLGAIVNVTLSLLLLSLILDWISYLVILFLGVALGSLFYWFWKFDVCFVMTAKSIYHISYVLVIGSLLGLIFSRYRDRLVTERIKSMRLLASIIANEMRTPFASISINASSLWSKINKLTSVLPVKDIQELESIAFRTETVAKQAQSNIDLLLTNIHKKVDESKLRLFSVNWGVQSALDAYPFTECERSKIHFDVHKNFMVCADEGLLKNVIFNLLKNSLYAIKSKGSGEVYISFRKGEITNKLIFKDTGCGISPTVLPYIFGQFYAYKSPGAGLGLFFCKKVMHRFNGDINCFSQEGKYTEFVLTFPPTEEKV